MSFTPILALYNVWAIKTLQMQHSRGQKVSYYNDYIILFG